MEIIFNKKVIAINAMVEKIAFEVAIYVRTKVKFKAYIPSYATKCSDFSVTIKISAIAEKILNKRVYTSTEEAFKNYQPKSGYMVYVINRENLAYDDYYKIELVHELKKKAKQKKIKPKRKSQDQRRILRYLTILGEMPYEKIKKLLPQITISTINKMVELEYIDFKQGIISLK
jgi:acyl-CoA hydrolase